jgi:hypothetical protein
MRLIFQPPSMKSAASQSSNSGWLGFFALEAEVFRGSDETAAEEFLPHNG